MPAMASARDVAVPQPPSVAYGDLFAAVQQRKIFADSKAFADAVPKAPPAAIMAAWRTAHPADDAALKVFVARWFAMPGAAATPKPSSARPSLTAHITALWPHLTRRAQVADGSALALPKPYVVPGGRFREMYYWDSYFTMLGLKQSHRQDLVEDMLDDFGALIDRYGHIPNGTRTYYLGRSQPPFFYLMTRLSADTSRAAMARRLGQMRAEYRFWMAGADGLKPGMAVARVVRMPDGALLNRYWDDRAAPRDESWREDVALAKGARAPAVLYRDIRAAAESGWDFSSRWLGDGRSMGSIATTRVVPVDLNSLLYGMERTIAQDCRALGNKACADDFTVRAKARQAAIERYLWNGAGFYADYDLARQRVSDAKTAAMAFPLFTGVATPQRARATAAAVQTLMAQGGLLTTTRVTGQQWDAPNGWAPLQWVAAVGLRAYGDDHDATRIETAWMATVMRQYCASGKLLEKYDVRDQRAGGGGEYPLQDGFGWTNGVALAMLDDLGRHGGAPSDRCN